MTDIKLKPHDKVLLVDHRTRKRRMYDGDAAQLAWARYRMMAFMDAKAKVICDMVEAKQ